MFFKVKDKKIVLENNVVIYPSYYFCKPQDNKENYAIHHFDGSWLDPYVRKNKFSFGKYTLVTIKANNIAFKNSIKLDEKKLIKENEHIVFKFRKSKRKTTYLIKRK